MKKLLLLLFTIVICSCGVPLHNASNPIKERVYKEFPQYTIDSIIDARGINSDSITWRYNRVVAWYNDTVQIVTNQTTLYRLPVDSTLIMSVIMFNDTTFIFRYRIEKEENIDY